VFLPIDPFTVNLSDRETDRYAQVQVTLEVVDQKTADTLKTYMPSIRSGILMVLSHKTAVEMLSREGKERLQKEIQAESLRPLGIEMELDAGRGRGSAEKEEERRKSPPATR
jgi:flagellar FliL protein